MPCIVDQRACVCVCVPVCVRARLCACVRLCTFGVYACALMRACHASRTSAGGSCRTAIRSDHVRSDQVQPPTYGAPTRRRRCIGCQNMGPGGGSAQDMDTKVRIRSADELGTLLPMVGPNGLTDLGFLSPSAVLEGGDQPLLGAVQQVRALPLLVFLHCAPRVPGPLCWGGCAWVAWVWAGGSYAFFMSLCPCVLSLCSTCAWVAGSMCVWVGGFSVAACSAGGGRAEAAAVKRACRWAGGRGTVCSPHSYNTRTHNTHSRTHTTTHTHAHTIPMLPPPSFMQDTEGGMAAPSGGAGSRRRKTSAPKPAVLPVVLPPLEGKAAARPSM